MRIRPIYWLMVRRTDHASCCFWALVLSMYWKMQAFVDGSWSGCLLSFIFSWTSSCSCHCLSFVIIHAPILCLTCRLSYLPVCSCQRFPPSCCFVVLESFEEGWLPCWRNQHCCTVYSLRMSNWTRYQHLSSVTVIRLLHTFLLSPCLLSLLLSTWLKAWPAPAARVPAVQGLWE